MKLGPPPAHLPVGWTTGLSPARILRVALVELHGRPLAVFDHHKGYKRVYLGRGNPYADSSGCTTLHRWVMQRTLGRRLPWWQHVHHRPGGLKTSVNVNDLEILEMEDHGRWHWRRSAGRLDIDCNCRFSSEELAVEANKYAAVTPPAREEWF
jgi:hypothetical protein